MKKENSRMAKNTLFMYFRMVILMSIQLYTVPIVLSSLGVEDYGIYQVVGGFVALFSFIHSSLISGCQRFLSFAIGENQTMKLKKTFDVTITIFFFLSLLIFFLVEIAGVWYLNTKMVIPPNRLVAANLVFQFSLTSLIVTILITPFTSVVIAHEHMSVFAYVSVLESMIKLCVALTIQFIGGDVLSLYAGLMTLSSVLVTSYYFFYGRSHFQETGKLRFCYDLGVIRDIGFYAGWNIIGSTAIVLRNHGLNLVMNLFFGPLINAAHSLAFQINGVFTQVVYNVYMATRPQMVKQYAKGHLDEMWKIVFRSSRYSFFLFGFLAIPFYIEADVILHFWLSKVPPHTVMIAKLLIVASLVETLCNQIIGAFQAANKLKCMQLISNTLLLLVVPLAYFSLLLTADPRIPYILYTMTSVLYVVIIVAIAACQINLDWKQYLSQVIFRSLMPFVASFLICQIISGNFGVSFQDVVIMTVISTMSLSILVWIIGLDKQERSFVTDFVKSKLGHNE